MNIKAGDGDYRLYYNTCYAIELNIRTNLAGKNGDRPHFVRKRTFST